MTETFKKGDRIKLVQMGPDPCPVPEGTTGTVMACDEFPDKSWQIAVNWDNGRTLSVIVPPDVIEKLP